jgi:hypothetical protein
VLAFLVRLVFVVVLARLFLGLMRLVQGPRRRRQAGPPRQEVPPHLQGDIVDGEFEDLHKERDG